MKISYNSLNFCLSPCLGIFLLKAAASGPAHVQLFLDLQQAVYQGFEVWQSRYSRHSWNAHASPQVTLGIKNCDVALSFKPYGVRHSVSKKKNNLIK